eukprot:TRINITY_DN18106_c0_g1_i1.p1 TRINITY_DN18106_c0_g1~~TRINITY_DN18106_c0_g1_i1.p1  ORF type:complete len:129 (+),score=5.99 TRINITY_DN18106_c0_g1_i1:342-728(+)
MSKAVDTMGNILKEQVYQNSLVDANTDEFLDIDEFSKNIDVIVNDQLLKIRERLSVNSLRRTMMPMLSSRFLQIARNLKFQKNARKKTGSFISCRRNREFGHFFVRPDLQRSQLVFFKTVNIIFFAKY